MLYCCESFEMYIKKNTTKHQTTNMASNFVLVVKKKVTFSIDTQTHQI